MSTLDRVALPIFHSSNPAISGLLLLFSPSCSSSTPIKLFFKSLLRAELGKTAVQRSPISGLLAHFLVEFSVRALFFGITTLSDAGTIGEISLRRSSHTSDSICSGEFILVTVGSAKTPKQ